MKKTAMLIAMSMLAAPTGSPLPSIHAAPSGTPAPEVKTIRCESSPGTRKYCRVNTKDGVRLTYQLSEAGCWEGDTWGYDDNGIWVSNGCRAEFEVGKEGMSTGEKVAIGVGLGAIAAGIIGAIIANRNRDDDDYYDNPYYGDRIKCESNNKRYKACETGRIRYAEIVRQISGSPCQFNYSWGYARNYVWVNHGCRAEFSVRRY